MSGSQSGGQSPWGAARSEPGIGWSHVEQARAFLHAKNPDSAIREAAKALDDEPSGMLAYVALDIIADAFWMKRDHMEVWAIGERMIDITPDHAAAFIHIARGALTAKDWRRFVEITKRGLELHPNNACLMQLVGIRWRIAGGLDTAEKWARAALEQQPGNPHLLTDLAVVQIKKGRHGEARTIIDEMLRSDPNGTAALSLATLEAYTANRFADAAALAAMTLERDPEDGDCRIILARSRFLGHPLMKPYWAFDRMSMLTASVVVGVLAVILMRLGAAPLLGALIGYVVLCIGVIGLVEYRYRDAGPMTGNDRPQVSIKDY